MKMLQRLASWLVLGLIATGLQTSLGAAAATDASLEVGLAVRDITPQFPVWLAGYAARKKPADKVDLPLVAQALALKNPSGERFVFVSLDNCEVSREFNEPVIKQLEEQHQLARGAVMIVSSHTHSAPVLEGNLLPMYQMPDADREQVQKYGRWLQEKLVEVVGAALTDFKPALLEHGIGRATFAMNRRVYRGDTIAFGENPEAPVDWDVPVLRLKGTNGAVRAIVFGYACHPTSIAGDDFYIVTGDYPAYARQHLEAVYPGTMALFLQGMGADSNPAPRGSLLDSKRHGLELAGAVAGVLKRPMRPVRGTFKLAYAEVELPFTNAPTRERLETDAQNKDIYVQNRARTFLKLLDDGKPLPQSVKLPVSMVQIGSDLTFLAMGGEVVVDYARQFKRMFAASHPWPIGYAYEVPCYIPTARIIKEGGYEPDSSLIYYGFYGPFRTQVEEMLLNRMTQLAGSLRNP